MNIPDVINLVIVASSRHARKCPFIEVAYMSDGCIINIYAKKMKNEENQRKWQNYERKKKKERIKEGKWGRKGEKIMTIVKHRTSAKTILNIASLLCIKHLRLNSISKF